MVKPCNNLGHRVRILYIKMVVYIKNMKKYMSKYLNNLQSFYP